MHTHAHTRAHTHAHAHTCTNTCPYTHIRHLDGLESTSGDDSGSEGHASHGRIQRSYQFGLSECRRLWTLAGPLVVQNVFGYSLSIVSAIAVGHLK